MNKVYCYCYRYPLLRLSINQTAVSAEPDSSTGKLVPGCTDRLTHNSDSKYNRWVSSYTWHVSLSRDSVFVSPNFIRQGGVQSADTPDATSARHWRCHISAAQCLGSYNVSLCPSSVLTTSACAHHRFLQRQPVPIIGSIHFRILSSHRLWTWVFLHHG